MSLFGDWNSDAGGTAESGTGTDGLGFDERLAIPSVDFDKGDRLRNEKEMLGLYVSDHRCSGSKRR